MAVRALRLCFAFAMNFLKPEVEPVFGVFVLLFPFMKSFKKVAHELLHSDNAVAAFCVFGCYYSAQSEALA